MNKIIIENNELKNYTSNEVNIKDNNIYLIGANSLTIDYINTTKANITLNIQKNAHINIYEFSNNDNLDLKTTYILEEGSNLTINKYYNNKEINEEVTINLNGEKATIKYNFAEVNTAGANHHIIINHNHNHTTSNIYTHILEKNTANINVTVDSILPKQTPKCYLNQETKIMTLGTGTCQIKPNMYIDEDDVEARHGSVIGTFSEDTIFYLMSRGVPREKALELLIKGHILSPLDFAFDFKQKIIETLNNQRRWNNEQRRLSHIR